MKDALTMGKKRKKHGEKYDKDFETGDQELVVSSSIFKGLGTTSKKSNVSNDREKKIDDVIISNATSSMIEVSFDVGDAMSKDISVRLIEGVTVEVIVAGGRIMKSSLPSLAIYSSLKAVHVKNTGLLTVSCDVIPSVLPINIEQG